MPDSIILIYKSKVLVKVKLRKLENRQQFKCKSRTFLALHQMQRIVVAMLHKALYEKEKRNSLVNLSYDIISWVSLCMSIQKCLTIERIYSSMKLNYNFLKGIVFEQANLGPLIFFDTFNFPVYSKWRKWRQEGRGQQAEIQKKIIPNPLDKIATGLVQFLPLWGWSILINFTSWWLFFDPVWVLGKQPCGALCVDNSR